MSPDWRRLIFAASMSTQKTSFPSSANPAAVTRPTYPVPITPIGSRAALMSRGNLLTESGERPGDGDHLLVAQRLKQRVRDPIHGAGGLPRDQAQPAAVVVELELAADHLHLVVGAVEDRRVHPVGALDAV